MERKKRVLVDAFPRHLDEIFLQEDWAHLQKLFDPVWAKDEPLPVEEYDSDLHDVFAVISCGWKFGDVARLPELRAILDVGGSLPKPSALDYQECFRRQIRVLTCSPAFGPMVAEMALGAALACTRQIVAGDRLFRSGEERYLHAGNEGTFTLYGRRIGFVGYGSLARHLQLLLSPFHCSLFAYDPWLTKRVIAAAGAIPSSLDEVMSRCDVIFVLAPPTSENQHMISRRHLEMIRNHAAFVLMSRAHVVDFDALTDLVLEGRFRAAIDVFPQEPLPGGHAIRSAELAVLSAHRAGSVRDDLRTIGRMAVDDLEAMLKGLPPREMDSAQPELIHRF